MLWQVFENCLKTALQSAFLTSTVAPKPRAEASSPSAPAKGNGLSKDRFLFKRIFKNPLQSHINGVIIKYNKYCKVRSGK